MKPDTLGRTLQHLRVSITDRCNFRCSYCMPADLFDADVEFTARDDLLDFEEIERLTLLFVRLGVHRVKITGGEPLLRRGLETLVSKLAALEGIRDLGLTTNGALLDRRADALAAAGLHRVTVSLDALEDEVFRRINGVGFPVARVLSGIEAAEAAGLTPIKINVVVKRGLNEDQVVPLARHFRETGHIVRFIEYMDVGTTNSWRLDDVVPSVEIVQTLTRGLPLEPLPPQYPGEVARRWRYSDGSGEIGVVTSVTAPFCDSCNRARLSVDGKLFTCLFGSPALDLAALLRTGASDRELLAAIAAAWDKRIDRYSLDRALGVDQTNAHASRPEMNYIGG